MTWRFGLLLIALVGVALATWLIRSDPEPAAEDLSQTTTERGYYLRGASIIGTDDRGELLYEIVAERALQETSLAPVELTTVQLDYKSPEAVWQLKAGEATLAADGERLSFRDNVIATRSGGPQEVVIYTDSLNFDPEAQIVDTDATVRFELGDGRLLATGMLAYLEEDRIELRSNIRGQFDPR